MSFSNTAETAVLEQIFEGTALPWDALLVDNNDSGTFGQRLQKLLTTSKFIGLK